jgi:hypothetical protein
MACYFANVCLVSAWRHYADLGCTADDSEILAISIFKAKELPSAYSKVRVVVIKHHARG